MLNNSVESAFRNAKKFINKNDFDNASLIYKDILNKFPKNKRASDLLSNLKNTNVDKDIKAFEKLFSQGSLLQTEKEGEKLFQTYNNEIKFLRVFGTVKANLGKLNEAKKVFIKLLEIEPNPYMTLANLGNICYLENKFDEATIYFKKALEENSKFGMVYNGLGLLFLKKNEIQSAIENFQKCLQYDSKDSTAILNLGNCFQELKMLDKAMDCYEKVLHINKDSSHAYNNIANIYDLKKEFDLAIDFYSKAIEINVNYYEAYNNRGVVYSKTDRIDEAFKDFEKAISISPNYPNPHRNLGNIHFQKNNFLKAKKFYLISIDLLDGQHEILNNLGVCYTNLKEYKKSLDIFDQAINAKLDYAPAYNNKGNALNALERFEEAFQNLEQAQKLDPDNHETPLNIGNVMLLQSRYAEATKYYEQAVQVKPDYADAYFNLSLIKLLHSDFYNGFKLYEWRLDKNRKDLIFNNIITKRWNGKDNLDGKTIVILSEQGLGDTFQFSRFINLFDLKNTKIIFKVQDCLIEIISTMNKQIKVIGNSQKVDHFDYQIPLLSLPFAFNTTYLTIPCEKKYLKAKKELVKHWKDRIGSNGFKIGIAWQGSSSDADRFRSFQLKEFEILSSLKNVRLISLQKNNGSEELKSNTSFKVEDFNSEMDIGDQAFLDTAAIIENLDLVITCDTSIAHLSGALNCPTWIMLAATHDWRWFFDNQKSPWYPSVKLFRQTELQDWTHPFEYMKRTLITDFKI